MAMVAVLSVGAHRDNEGNNEHVDGEEEEEEEEARSAPSGCLPRFPTP